MKTTIRDDIATLVDNTADAVKRIGENNPYRGSGFENWMSQCGITASASIRFFEEGKTLSKPDAAFVDAIMQRAGYHFSVKFKPVSWHGLELIDRVLTKALETHRFLTAEQLEFA